MPFFIVSPSSWPVTWRTAFSGVRFSTAVKGVLAVWAMAGRAARTAAAISSLRIISPLGFLLEDQIGEGMARGRREDVRHARRNHQPVASMQELEFAAHQLAAADLAVAGIGAAVLGAAIGDAAFAIQDMDVIVPVVMGFGVGVDHPGHVL